MVRNAMRHAIGSNYLLNLSKLVCRHSRKQVVFDLTTQSASAVIDSRMVLDVPTREDLLAQEVYRRGALEQRHALMIGSEYQCQIQSEERLLRQDENNGAWPA